jgi:hypothetical protein
LTLSLTAPKILLFCYHYPCSEEEDQTVVGYQGKEKAVEYRHFATPLIAQTLIMQVWYASPEEKDQILEGYKRKLKAIDCRHFNYGDGSCPFGTSCFYRHRFKDGREEEVVLRHLGTADGTVAIAKSVR